MENDTAKERGGREKERGRGGEGRKGREREKERGRGGRKLDSMVVC